VTGLTNGTPYLFRVAAINSVGTGTYSNPSNAVTPDAMTTPNHLPDAPTDIIGTAGDAQVTLSWTAPVNTGSGPITGYTVEDSTDGGSTWLDAARKARPDGRQKSHTVPATTQIVTGLVNGTSYRFRVAATNDSGIGLYSEPSSALTPTARTAHLSISSPDRITVGSAVTIHTTLDDAATSLPIAGKPVRLVARYAASGPWNVVGTDVTPTSGHAHVKLAPTRNTEYQWRFDGDASHRATKSTTRTVLVAQRVTIHITGHHGSAGSKIQVYGAVAPKAVTKTVKLQVLRHGQWRSTGSAAKIIYQPTPHGPIRLCYVIDLPTRSAGKYTYRIHRAPTSHNAASNSSAVHLHVT
jgi:hypothetical protein